MLTTLTDEEGRYTLSGIPLCYCMKEVTVTKEGYESHSESVAVGVNTMLDITLNESPDGHGIIPSVTDGKGRPALSLGSIAALIGLVALLTLVSMLVLSHLIRPKVEDMDEE
jgi:hypothetical protein